MTGVSMNPTGGARSPSEWVLPILPICCLSLSLSLSFFPAFSSPLLIFFLPGSAMQEAMIFEATRELLLELEPFFRRVVG